jgi:hypothetical protein
MPPAAAAAQNSTVAGSGTGWAFNSWAPRVVVVGLVKFVESKAPAAAALNVAVGLTIMAKFAFRASI